MRRRVADSAGDDDCSIAIAPVQSGASQVLGKPTDEAHGSSRSERGQVVLVHLVAETGVSDLVESQELVETVGATVGQSCAPTY